MWILDLEDLKWSVSFHVQSGEECYDSDCVVLCDCVGDYQGNLKSQLIYVTNDTRTKVNTYQCCYEDCDPWIWVCILITRWMIQKS